MEEPRNEKDAIKNWTQEEKYHLLEALKHAGKIDLKVIESAVKTKTPEEIKLAVEYYKNVAVNHPLFDEMRRNAREKEKKERLEARRESRKRIVELAKWKKLVMGMLSKDNLNTETAAALRLIADCEAIPPPEMTENVDFRQVYHQIANAMEGKPIEADPATIAVMKRCLAETSLRSEKMNDCPEIKQYLMKFVENKKGPDGKPIPPKPTTNHELAVLRHLVAQKCHNPLDIPEELLKPPTASSSKGKKSG